MSLLQLPNESYPRKIFEVPVGQWKINKNSPFARNLQACIMQTDAGPFDLVTNKGPISGTGTREDGVHVRGPSRNFDSGSDFFETTKELDDVTSSKYSWAVYGEFITPASWSFSSLFNKTTDTGNTEGFGVFQSGNMRMSHGTTGGSIDTGVDPADFAGEHRMGGVWTGTRGRIFQDTERIADVAFSGNPVTGTGRIKVLSNRDTSTSEGFHYLTVVWNRPLSDNEMLLFLADPFQILEPIAPLVSFFEAVIAPTFGLLQLPKESHPEFADPRLKPNVPADIDYDGLDAAKHLAFAWLADNGPRSRNLVSGEVPTVTGTIGLQTSIQGLELSMDGLDEDARLRFLNSGELISTTESFAVFAEVDLTDFNESTLPNILNIQSDGGIAFTLFLGDAAGFSGVNFGSNGTWSQLRASIGPSALSGPIRIALLYNGESATTDGNFELYVDGVLQTLITPSAFSSVTNETTIGPSSPDATNWWDGGLGSIYIYRGISMTAAKQLIQRHHAALKPVVPFVSFFETAIAGVTRTSLIIGGGFLNNAAATTMFADSIVSGGGVITNAASADKNTNSIIVGGGVLIDATIAAKSGTSIIIGGGVTLVTDNAEKSTTSIIIGGGVITNAAVAIVAATSAIIGGGVSTDSAIKGSVNFSSVIGGGLAFSTSQKSVSSVSVITGGGIVTQSGSLVDRFGSSLVVGGGLTFNTKLAGIFRTSAIIGGGVLVNAVTTARNDTSTVAGGGFSSVVATGNRFTNSTIVGGGFLTVVAGVGVIRFSKIIGGGVLLSESSKVSDRTSLITGGGIATNAAVHQGIGASLVSGGGVVFSSTTADHVTQSIIFGGGLSLVIAEGGHSTASIILGGGFTFVEGASFAKLFVKEQFIDGILRLEGSITGVLRLDQDITGIL